MILKKQRKKLLIPNFYLNYHFFQNLQKKLCNYQLSKELPFFPKRPKKLNKLQILKNILPLYDRVGISKRQRAFRGCAKTFNVEVVDRKNLSDSLFLARSSIVDLFSDLLQEKRGFKYILSTTITLKIWNNATNSYDIETAYFNPEAITVTNQRFNSSKPYQELKHRLDLWCERGSGWIVDKLEAMHIKICNYDPLSGSSYIPLPPKVNNSMKDLINHKNKNIGWFKWCHVRFLNPPNKNSDRINKQDKKIASTLDYRGINFPMKARDYEIIEERFEINVNDFGYENKVFPLFVSKKIK